MSKKMPNHSGFTLLILMHDAPQGLTVQELTKKQKIKRLPTVYQLVEKLMLCELVDVVSTDKSNEGRPLRRHGLTARGKKCAMAYKKLKEAFEAK